MKPFSAQTHYEVLEISVSASRAEIRHAFERLMQLYADEQVALYGLIDGARAGALRARLMEALEVLTDEDRRDRYDLALGLPPRQPSVPTKSVSPVAPPARIPVATTGPSSVATGHAAFSWVTSAPPAPAPSQPQTYSYAVTPAPVAVPAPAPKPAPATAEPVTSPEPPPVAPAPIPLLLTQAIEVKPEPVQPEEPTVSQSEVAESLDAVSETAPIQLSDEEVEVAIIPGKITPSREFRLERPKPHEIPEGVEINGDLLRQVRMARGLSLTQLAERTRIGTKHLENVEGDHYDALPAPVYLRGILMNLARELGLDGVRVSQSYMTFVEARRTKA